MPVSVLVVVIELKDGDAEYVEKRIDARLDEMVCGVTSVSMSYL